MDEDPFFLITTYNPAGNALKEIVDLNWEILQRSSATKQLAEKKPMFGYRRPPNLRDMLVTAKVKTNTRTFEPREVASSQTINQCKTRGCRYCSKLDTSGYIMSTHAGKKYVCRKNVTCKSTNLIYCITCKVCKVQYVGQTKGTLMDRFKAHFGVVNRRDMKEDIGRHFNSAKHHGIDDMELHVLDFIYSPAEADFSLDIRLQIEFQWIHAMHTMAPHGLNMKDRAPKAKYCRDIINCTKRYNIIEVKTQRPNSVKVPSPESTRAYL